MAEWLRRWTANPLCSARVGSNPILVENIFFLLFFFFVNFHFLGLFSELSFILDVYTEKKAEEKRVFFALPVLTDFAETNRFYVSCVFL